MGRPQVRCGHVRAGVRIYSMQGCAPPARPARTNSSARSNRISARRPTSGAGIEILDCAAEASLQRYLRRPAERLFGETDIRTPLDRIILRQRLENDFRL